MCFFFFFVRSSLEAQNFSGVIVCGSLNAFFFFLIGLLCGNRPRIMSRVLCTCAAPLIVTHAVSTNESLLLVYSFFF